LDKKGNGERIDFVVERSGSFEELLVNTSLAVPELSRQLQLSFPAFQIEASWNFK